MGIFGGSGGSSSSSSSSSRGCCYCCCLGRNGIRQEGHIRLLEQVVNGLYGIHAPLLRSTHSNARGSPAPINIEFDLVGCLNIFRVGTTLADDEWHARLIHRAHLRKVRRFVCLQHHPYSCPSLAQGFRGWSRHDELTCLRIHVQRSTGIGSNLLYCRTCLPNQALAHVVAVKLDRPCGGSEKRHSVLHYLFGSFQDVSLVICFDCLLVLLVLLVLVLLVLLASPRTQ